MKWEPHLYGFCKKQEELVCFIPELEHSVGNARFTIRRDWKEGYYAVTWWHGNQGHHIANGGGIDSAKELAAAHLRRIVNGMIDALVTTPTVAEVQK